VPDWDNKSILTPTGGFLKQGFSHSLNPYLGCSFAGALCGTFCYAQHNQWIVKGRAWGLYAAKRDVREAYRRDHDRWRRKGGRALRIYMSSSTDPYLPQEVQLRRTRAALEEMLVRPPDVLVLQSHSTGAARDLELLRELSGRCELWLSITVETDLDPVPGFPRHASPPAARLALLERFRAAGVRTQATLSPLLPVGDLDAFAARLDRACDRVVVDHFLLGDGAQGARTRRTRFIELLEANGFGRWARLEAMEQVASGLRAALGPERVGVSAAGFNDVGRLGPVQI
jgi:DNA repair photolyase